ncbi:MAG: hypothetical protein KF745_11305 [Phycisphaeraceae bacterium]|nr:hypothetical protein [Phycisphaeraceae bacterium]
MFAKICAVIVTVGVIGCVLLTNRQLRLQAVHDLAVLQKRVAEHDRALWHLRVEIAGSVTPGNVEQLARAIGPLESLPVPARPGAVPASQVASAAVITARQDSHRE